MERKLASVQLVTGVEPVENADTLDKVTILGWHCVTRKGEFSVGDRCVYVEVDALLPDRPEFEFLKPRGMRIRTIKLRGQVSQGICFPLSILPDGPVSVGADVTEVLGITKYEVPVSMSGKPCGVFPGFLPKTDETRIQAFPDVLTRHKGVECYLTEKVDGCSITAWVFNGEYGIASRNLRYDPTDTNVWCNVAADLQLEAKIRSLGRNVALQGEVLGRVQKNKYQLKKETVLWFNVFDIDTQNYLPYKQFLDVIRGLGLMAVPQLGTMVLDHTVDSLVELAKGKSVVAPIHREGVVIRAVDNRQDIDLGRLSFKVINPDFLLKYEE